MAERSVTLDAGIYKAAAVKAAIKDYSGVARISMKKDDAVLTVIFESWPEEYSDTIEFEFCNYVLWKMRN